MNSAKLNRSIRLQRVLKVLMDGCKHTTRDLIRRSGMCAINSIISELRDNGIKISCQRKENRWYYWLES